LVENLDSLEEKDVLYEEKTQIDYFLKTILFILVLIFLSSSVVKLILFSIIIIIQTNKEHLNQREFKQMHIFYDYEIFVEFIKSLDYNFYKSLNPFFGLMDAHIKSYIRLHGIDLHFYEIYPEVAEWRKRGYERDFEWVFKRLNVILEDKNIVFVYSLDNIKEYGFKYYNY